MNLHNKEKLDSLYLEINKRLEIIEKGKKHLKIRIELNFSNGLLSEKVKIFEPTETIKI